ncbi:uncharacterized protein LOC122849264 isoform X1 [Aphidius gifuensis]|nr:uncharacterized protein LOC122849264 isoform X1 [Aphidius gifuensis]
MDRRLDRLQEICIRIHNTHLTYLETNDSPSKIKERYKLEGFINEYVGLVPNEKKYVFQETSDILLRSAETLEGFSVYRASEAWSAISIYASNLLAQPWRKEYRSVQTYSGYYKHEIEANLFQAELMFYLMGYKKSEHSVLTLDGPIDPDKVSNVSRDAIVAFVECQILKKIFETVSKSFSISWFDIIEHRRKFVGTAEQAIRSIHQLLQRDNQNKMKSENYPQYYQKRFNSTTSDDTFEDNFNDSSDKKIYDVVATTEFTPNCAFASRSVSCEIIKTDRLVISGSQNQLTKNLTSKIMPQSNKRHEKCDNSCDSSRKIGQTDINLIDYSMKYLCERDMSFVRTSVHQNSISSESNTLHRTSENTKHPNDRELIFQEKKKARRKNDDSAISVERLHRHWFDPQITFLNTVEKKMSSNPELQKNLKSSLNLIDLNKISQKVEIDESHRLKSATQLYEKADKFSIESNNEHQNIGYHEWNCLFCTFINTTQAEICQMCGKSRRSVPNEKPLESGSKQCPNCTLVNNKIATMCEVCETNLENSPTYV